ncbi:ribonuclease domain-containing protein [Nocardioides sp. Bht2]|uniref:ribonuclease domain-containing protein n=1 Tax=Nocardioides sp. Bht2 TaxID=3392297 RepID=UPI0039B45DD8
MSSPRSGPRWLRLLGGVLVALIAIAGWWLQSGPDSSGGDRTPDAATAPATPGVTGKPGSTANPGSNAKPQATAKPDAGRTGTDPVSGLRWVAVDALPAEAARTLRLIDDGGPFPYDRDGITFGNYEGILPKRARGYYAEYTVPTPGLDHRGARRIVTGDGDEYYFTGDHYASFERIDR